MQAEQKTVAGENRNTFFTIAADRTPMQPRTGTRGGIEFFSRKRRFHPTLRFRVTVAEIEKWY
jgi:hypothetical protein